MKNKRFPNYPDDTDYTTNSPSYYDDLARKQKLIQLLAEKIWEYENTLNESLEQIEQRLTDYMLENDLLMQTRLENWDKRIDEMPEEMRSLFVAWLNDGTLEQIINHDVLGNKADKEYVSQENTSLLTETQQSFALPNDIVSGIVTINFKGNTDGGVSDFTILSRTKNLFDVSKVTKNALLDGSGTLAGKTEFNVTDFMWLKAGSYRVKGLTRSAMSGGNAYFIRYDRDKKFVALHAVGSTAPVPFTMPADGYIRHTIHENDLETYQIESGTTTTDYEKGKETKVSVSLGSYPDGTPFKLHSNGTVYDEVKRIGNDYVRIQRLDKDGMTPLLKPLLTFEGENGFSVEGSHLDGYKGNTIHVVTANSIPKMEIEYPTSLESRNINTTNETSVLMDKLTNVEKELKKATENSPHFEPIKLEKMGHLHRGGYPYTSFSTGATIQGREIYVSRSATHHSTDPGTISRTIAYIRNGDGSFDTRILPLDYTQGDFRDPNITTDKSGRYLLLTVTSYDRVTYKSWLYIFDKDLNKLGTEKLIANDIFTWGNTLVTPSGKLITTAYVPSENTGTNHSGVYLYASSGTVDNIGSFSRVATIIGRDLIDNSETTICYWGNKLVAMSRRDDATTSDNAMVSFTNDLEGLTGWENNEIQFKVDAPALQPYNDGRKPLIASISYYNDVIKNRKPALTASADLINWTTPIVLNENILEGGGYTSFVRNRYGYGVMYFDEAVGQNGTNLYFQDVDIYTYLPQLLYLESQMS